MPRSPDDYVDQQGICYNVEQLKLKHDREVDTLRKNIIETFILTFGAVVLVNSRGKTGEARFLTLWRLTRLRDCTLFRSG